MRDCDVVTKLLAGRDLPRRGGVRRRISTSAARRLCQFCVAALDRWVARRCSSKWRAALLSCPVEDAFQPALHRAARKFLAHGDAVASANASATQLHRFRIESKRFRYTLELFDASWGPPVREWLERLRPVQPLLGDTHDSYMAREVAARCGGTPEIDAWLKRRQSRKTRQFSSVWAESFLLAERRLRLAALRHPPRKPALRTAAKSAAAGAAHP